jgi:HEAT repeat protein
MGPPALPALPKLIQRLEDSSPQVRKAAAHAIATFGTEGLMAAEGLSKLTDDSDVQVQSAALNALFGIGARAELVASCAKFLNSPIQEVRVLSARLLSESGPEAETVLPQLIEALKNADFNVRMYAARALGNMGIKAISAKPALQAAAWDPNAYVREAVKEALSKI